MISREIAMDYVRDFTNAAKKERSVAHGWALTAARRLSEGDDDSDARSAIDACQHSLDVAGLFDSAAIIVEEVTRPERAS